MSDYIDCNDKITGMLIGFIVGDALGSPYEFHPKHAYTGVLEHQVEQNVRYQGKRIFPLGMASDDTELMLTLANSLIKKGTYDRSHVVMSYLDWANSNCKFMGNNTKAMFKGVTTYNGYEKRLDKVLKIPMEERSQSNGSIMRCAPLVVFPHRMARNFARIDCDLSNPHPVNKTISCLYLYMLEKAMFSDNKSSVLNPVVNNPELPNLDKVIGDVIDDYKAGPLHQRNLVPQRGWCAHAFYSSIYSFGYFDSLQEVYDWCIGCNPGADTDTNAAISGALMGAFLGYKRIIEEPLVKHNLEVILNCDSGRPDQYHPRNIFKVATSLANLAAKESQILDISDENV